LAKCTAFTRGGDRCKGIAIDSSGYCYAHHPDHADARKRAAHRGGKRGGRGRPIAELGTLRDENADIRHRLLEGELLPNVAAVAVQSINTDIRAVGAAMKAREQEELVERVQELERRLSVNQRQKGRRAW
jgi:hypothetical protein